ncbi:hypothetical protein [Lactobacillus helveticus]|uniref:hypothetical protein n=1 Tax=Lactobacillus helveticus TaxID=1587 RepID=UPI00110998DD|nr:hypothetical protein [Lactobacillus helveticus]TLQ21717.1 hypothetical protein FEZ38_06310 [Lactobacillus helveticus]
MTEKLSDVLDGEGTNLVYISGKLDGKQIDFDGPIEWTRKFDRPTYPIVPALPQYDPSVFKNPVFDYESSHWIEKDADAQAEQIAKLKQENDELKKEKQTETATSQKQDEKMDKLIKLIAMTNAQIGTLLEKSTGSTTSTQPSQPTTASVVQPTSPVTQQPTAPVTATEGGKK